MPDTASKEQARQETPIGLVIAGLRGGSGKSIVTVGLVAALRRQGKRVVPFKKGPDYIDAGWLQMAAENPCYNLDPYLMEREAILTSFREHAKTADLVIIEGNRGLFDGVDVKGGYSTAELAQILDLPVLLVVDCTKSTRTVAALVLGCREMDHNVRIRGVVLNQVAGGRHERIVRESVEHYTGIPVLGAVPRLAWDAFPMRHLGVTPFQEHANVPETMAMLADMAERYLDLAGVQGIMENCISRTEPGDAASMKDAAVGATRVRIGVVQDAAFQFYYPDNLEELIRHGAQLVAVNALTDSVLPDDLDALYIGGGFPETNAAQLSANTSFRNSVKTAAEAGLPIYAECGGLIYLGERIILDNASYPLAGVFPVTFTLEKKPQAHGYTVLTVEQPNAFYTPGLQLKGHEFRYSKVQEWQGRAEELIFRMDRGVGFAEGRDGLVYNNVLALYTHVHALGTPQWAESLVRAARNCREGRP